MKDKELVGKHGLFTSIVVAVVGVAIFSYPKELATFVGSDGWIVTIFSGIISFLLLYLMYKVIEMNNYDNFTNILYNNFGKVIGCIFALIFVGYCIFGISIGMRTFVEVTKMYLLEKTPTEFILIIMILTGTYLIRGEVRNLVKFNEIAFWVMFIPAVIVILFAINDADFTNLLPVLNNEPINYLKALKRTVYAFCGFEVLFLILPYVKNKKMISGTLKKSVVFITVFYLLIVIFTMAVFSKTQCKILMWPTITMIKSINIPGAFVERWEGIAMAFWVLFYFTTFVNIYYLACEIVKNIFKLQDIKLSSIIVMPLIYIVALYPENIAQVYDLQSNAIQIFAGFNLVILPLLLFIIGKSKEKRGAKNES